MQPTARSTSQPPRSTGSAPAECDRSQTASAPGVVHRAGDAGHVVRPAGAVVDVREADDRDVVVEDGADLLRFDAHHPQPQQVGHRVGDVEVGREVARLDHQRAAVRAQPGGRDERLEQVRRRRVGHDDLVRLGADQPGDPGTDPARRVPPVVGVPGRDQVRPHCCSTTSRTASGTAAGSAPSELPSR